MGLFDLVKEDDGEGVFLDGVGQLAARLVAHIAGRCAHQLLVGVGLAVLGHIKTDAGALVAEELLRQGLGGFRLAHASGACVEQHALGLGGRGGRQAVHAGHGALDHVQRALQGSILTLDALLKVLLGGAQAVHGQICPGILLHAILVQVNDGAQVADRGLLPLGEAAHCVQLGEGEALGQADELFAQPGQLVGMLLVEGHIRAIDRAVEEGRPGLAGNQALALLPVGGFNADGFAQRVVQVEPGRQIVELLHQQDQQILPLAHGGAHGGSAHGGLHQQVEAVHVILIHPLGGDDVVAGQLHYHGGGGVR